MSLNFSLKGLKSASATRRSWWMLLILPAWVFASFMVAKLVTQGIIWVLIQGGVPLGAMSPTVFSTVGAAFIYLLTLGLVIGLPWLVKRRQTSKEDVGLTRLPSWMDILLAPAGLIVYFITSAIIMLVVIRLVPGFNGSETQDVGFTQLNQRYEYILAFLTLVVIAPLAEEILFRGYLFGKLKKAIPLWLAILTTSALFGAVHGQWNVGLDTFALSVVMCTMRQVTGSIWVGVLMHMAKNGIAFYFIFINPTLLTTLGG